METEVFLEDLYRKKIKGWYSTTEDEDKAVKRMLKVRKEIIALLHSINREGIDNIIQYLNNSGFYYRASSTNGHHNFPGGLAEHSLGVYKYAKETAKAHNIPEDSVKIAALLHDICKADRCYFKERSIISHRPKCRMDNRHGTRSVYLIKHCGLKLTRPEYIAIERHLHEPSKARTETLWKIIYASDRKDAGDHPASHRKNQK